MGTVFLLFDSQQGTLLLKAAYADERSGTAMAKLMLLRDHRNVRMIGVPIFDVHGAPCDESPKSEVYVLADNLEVLALEAAFLSAEAAETMRLSLPAGGHWGVQVIKLPCFVLSNVSPEGKEVPDGAS